MKRTLLSEVQSISKNKSNIYAIASGEVKEPTLSDKATNFESSRKKPRIQMDCRDEVSPISLTIKFPMLTP